MIDVEVLIREHKKAVSTVDGIEIHSVPSLLSQLHDAVFGGMEKTGGSALGSKLPISAGALDLYMLIDRQITECWVALMKRVPSPSKPETLLWAWSIFVDPVTVVQVDGRRVGAVDAVHEWERMITDFFNPARMAEIQAPCFLCGERYVYAHDGTRGSALRFRRDRDTGETLDARCLACGAVWRPDRFEFLAESIGIAVDLKRAAHQETEVTDAVTQ